MPSQIQEIISLHPGAASLSADSSWINVGQSGYYNWHCDGTWNGATATLKWARDSAGTGAVAIDGAVLSADGGVLDIPISQGWVQIDFTGTPTAIVSSLRGIVT